MNFDEMAKNWEQEDEFLLMNDPEKWLKDYIYAIHEEQKSLRKLFQSEGFSDEEIEEKLKQHYKEQYGIMRDKFDFAYEESKKLYSEENQEMEFPPDFWNVDQLTSIKI